MRLIGYERNLEARTSARFAALASKRLRLCRAGGSPLPVLAAVLLLLLGSWPCASWSFGCRRY